MPARLRFFIAQPNLGAIQKIAGIKTCWESGWPKMCLALPKLMRATRKFVWCADSAFLTYKNQPVMPWRPSVKLAQIFFIFLAWNFRLVCGVNAIQMRKVKKKNYFSAAFNKNKFLVKDEWKRQTTALNIGTGMGAGIPGMNAHSALRQHASAQG